MGKVVDETSSRFEISLKKLELDLAQLQETDERVELCS